VEVSGWSWSHQKVATVWEAVLDARTVVAPHDDRRYWLPVGPVSPVGPVEPVTPPVGPVGPV